MFTNIETIRKYCMIVTTSLTTFFEKEGKTWSEMGQKRRLKSGFVRIGKAFPSVLLPLPVIKITH
jgi:hypothetical protein